MSVLNTLFLIVSISAFVSLAVVLFAVSIWSNRKAPSRALVQSAPAPTVASAWRGNHAASPN